MSEYDSSFVFVPIQKLQQLRGMTGNVNSIQIKLKPGVDGAEVLLRKKEDETIRDIPVIALTALDSPFDQIMWLARTDLQDFIVKSKLPRRELIARIERALQTSSSTQGPD